MSALDFGWCGFEIIWAIRDGHYHVERLKWLEPELTAILVDSHGNFAGLRQNQVDLAANKSLCVTVRGATNSPADFYGCSRLERVRELWSQMGRSAKTRIALYDRYVGSISSPYWFALTIQPMLNGLKEALNGLLAHFVAINFGDSPDKWACISFDPAPGDADEMPQP